MSAAIRKAAGEPSSPGHDPADRIVNRRHFRLLYERNPNDAERNPEAGEAVFNAACNEFGAERLRHDRYTEKGSTTGFPVRDRDGRIVSSLAKSDVLQSVPRVNTDYVFVALEIRSQAETWLKTNRESVISQMEPED